MKFSHAIAITYIRVIKAVRIFIIRILSALFFKKQSVYKKILINRDGAFGDSVVALPAINVIRQNYPLAQIDLLCINNGNVSFNNLGLVEGLIDNTYVSSKKERKKRLLDLKKEHYDLFIQIPQNIGTYKTIRNILFVRFFLNIQSAFGWDSGRVKSFMRLQKIYEPIPTETMRFIATLKQHGLIGEIAYPLQSRPTKNNELNSLVSESTPIAFLIGGKLQPKKWPMDYWVSLAKLIGDNEKILIIGGNAEENDAEYLKSKTTNTINLCGKLSIPELTYVFQNIKIAVSLDTGAMHLCDAAGAKLVALFSTRDLSNKWFPNNKSSIVIEKVLPCSFCLKSQCENNICMSNILPNEVYSRMKGLLSDRNASIQ